MHFTILEKGMYLLLIDEMVRAVPLTLGNAVGPVQRSTILLSVHTGSFPP